MKPTETPPPTKRTIAPALLVFLTIPLLGMVAAVGLLFTNAATSAPTPAPVTPPPPNVTFPVLPTPRALTDSPVIPFTLQNLAGETVSLDDYAGQIVFLNFWATWCEPCEREMPTFEAFTLEHEGDAVILAVNVEENADQVAEFLDELGITALPVLLDPDGDTATRYGIFNLPTTYVIDQSGIVRYPKYGEVTQADLAAYIEALTPTTDG